MNKIKIGIVGYGNLGKGVEIAISAAKDMNTIGIFTRRNPRDITSFGAPVFPVERISEFKNEIDVMILCGGSATDLFEQAPAVASLFHTVDSFDTHAKIPQYFELLDGVSQKSGKLAMISTGWDPGLFSMARVLFDSILPDGENYTFWGKGVSQGHSDALRRIDGVKNAVQYTVPNSAAIETLRSGKQLEISASQRHRRICYVVLEEDSDAKEIKEQIVTMPNYFAGYETEVYFISEEELLADHAGMPHGGSVFRLGRIKDTHNQLMEFHLQLESNPEFTAAVNVACARAVYRMAREGRVGALTIFDVPLAYLSPHDPAMLRKEML